MDHGGDAAGSTELGMAAAVQGREANIGSSSAFDGQLGGAAAPRVSFTDLDLSAVAGRAVVPLAAEFHLHREPGPGVAYPNLGASWRQQGPVNVVLVVPLLPGGGVPVHDNYGYSALQSRSGAGRGEVLVDLLPDGTGHDQVFVGLLPGGVDVPYDNYGYYALQLCPSAGHDDVLVDLLPDGAGHGEVFVGLVPGGGVAAHDDYGYYPWHPRPGAGRGEELPDGVGVVFDGIAGALRGPNLGVVGEHLRRFLPFAGIGACSVAVNGLAAGPGSPAHAFHLFVLLLGGLFLVILHVLRVRL